MGILQLPLLGGGQRLTGERPHPCDGLDGDRLRRKLHPPGRAGVCILARKPPFFIVIGVELSYLSVGLCFRSIIHRPKSARQRLLPVFRDTPQQIVAFGRALRHDSRRLVHSLLPSFSKMGNKKRSPNGLLLVLGMSELLFHFISFTCYPAGLLQAFFPMELISLGWCQAVDS